MATSTQALNPYRPTLFDSMPSNWHPVPRFGPIEIDVRKGWLFRHISIRGAIETEISWDARSANEYVKVDRRKVASKTSLLFVPRFEFPIETPGHVIAATIEVRISWLVIVSAFRLTLDEQVVYSEGVL